MTEYKFNLNIEIECMNRCLNEFWFRDNRLLEVEATFEQDTRDGDN